MYNFNKCLKNQSTNWENHAGGISLQKEDMMKIKNKIHQPKLARVVVLINPSGSSINPTTSTFSLILDPIFPDHEAYSDGIVNTIFGRRFGIPCQISD